MEQKQIIVCPHCKYEYLPAEIFLKGELIGKPKNVVRDCLGKIIYVEYEEDLEPTYEEKYICDGCGKAFVVEANVSYKTKAEDEALDFTTETTSLL